MNSHILVGYTFKKTHKVILDGESYSAIKKAFHEMKTSDEFSKLEIWSRTNGFEKSKKLKVKSDKKLEPTVDEDTQEPETSDESEDFQIEETSSKTPRKRRGRTS